MIKVQLTEDLYKILKQIDFKGYKSEITFYDDTFTFETERRAFVIFMASYISIYGMDEKQDRCTEYGRKLYDLYDYVMDEVSEE